MAFDAVIEISDSLIGMLATNIFVRVFMASVAGIAAVVVVYMAGYAAGVVVSIETEIFVVIEHCRYAPLSTSSSEVCKAPLDYDQRLACVAVGNQIQSFFFSNHINSAMASSQKTAAIIHGEVPMTSGKPILPKSCQARTVDLSMG